MTAKTKLATGSKKLDFADVATMVVFADVQKCLDKIAAAADPPPNAIANSPHGAFWQTDRNTFVGRYVNMVMPLNSAFYVYLDQGVMPPNGPDSNATQPECMATIKTWLSTGFQLRGHLWR